MVVCRQYHFGESQAHNGPSRRDKSPWCTRIGPSRIERSLAARASYCNRLCSGMNHLYERLQRATEWQHFQ